jgi:RNA polymerase sigma-70 factor (ECF subfamily)
MQDRASQDLSIVRSILEGDDSAFEMLVREYQTLVASIAWRYGVRQEDIEDVVSEVFLKTYRNLHLFRPDHPFSTWLYRLAANHVIDHGRRQKKEQARKEMPREVAGDGPTAREGLEEKERAALLRAALEELPRHYREVIFLVYIEGKKIDEVVACLDLPQGTVKTRLMRGREALRKILTRRHPGYFGE